MSSMMLIFWAIWPSRATVALTASPPSAASVARLGGHRVGYLRVPRVLRDRAVISSIEELVLLDFPEACSLAAATGSCEVVLTSSEAPVSASAAEITSPMMTEIVFDGRDMYFT